MLKRGFVPILILVAVVILGLTAGVYYLGTKIKQTPKPDPVGQADTIFGSPCTPPSIFPTNPLKEQIKTTYTKINKKVVDELNSYSQAKVVINLYPPPNSVDPKSSSYTSAIAKSQDSVLSKLTNHDFVLTYKYSHVPGLAGFVYTKDALDVFENSTEVQNLGLDSRVCAN